jgi:hypothetical protein
LTVNRKKDFEHVTLLPAWGKNKYRSLAYLKCQFGRVMDCCGVRVNLLKITALKVNKNCLSRSQVLQYRTALLTRIYII